MLSAKMRYVLLVVVTGVCYFVTGRLGLAFAADNAYATAIWIPSGIALAAVMAFGYRVFPGILVGSFLVNYTLTLSTAGSVSPVETAATFIIGGGAAAQACLARFLLFRIGDYPNPLADLSKIVRFIVIAGPLSCLLNATVGCVVLASVGLLSVDRFAQNWAIWWLGDSIGAALFGPMLMVWLLKPREHWRDRGLIVTLSLSLTFLLATIGFIYAKNSEENNVRLRLGTEVSSVAISFELALKAQTGVLETAARSIRLPQRSSRESYENQVRWLLEKYDNIQAVSWNPRITARERNYIEFLLQRDYGEDMYIREYQDGESVAAPERDLLIPVQYIYPLEGNESALGFNVASNPVRLEAMNQAMRLAHPVITEKINLVQDRSNQAGALLFSPRFDDDTGEIQGYLTAVIRIGRLVESFLQGHGFKGFLIRLYDISDADKRDGEAAELLYQTRINLQGRFEALDSKAIERFDGELIWQVPIRIADRTWQFRFVPTQDNYLSKFSASAWLVYILGLLFSIMSGMVALFFTGRAMVLESLVSERTQALRDSERTLNAIVQNSPDALLVVDDSGQIVNANKSAGTVFLLEPDSLLQSQVDQWIPYCNSVDFSQPQSRQSTDSIVETEGVRDDGSIVPVDCTFSEYWLSNQHYHLIIVRDITERAEVNRIKDEFISTVSHELRTPLTAIKGALGLIRAQSGLSEQINGLLDIAQRNSERLLELVNRILDFKKLTGQDFHLHVEEILVAEWLEDLCRLNQPFADGYSVLLRAEAAGTGLTVKGDRERLNQVMVNLISNAVKFSRPETEVVISAYRSGERIRFEVSDTGPGISDEFQQRIFGRFAQADSSSTRSQGGSGLGLNISKAIVERHGGEIGFENHESDGCTFYFELPA